MGKVEINKSFNTSIAFSPSKYRLFNEYD